MTVAEYLAERLYTEGVRFVFGIPGGASIPYLEAFRKRGIEFILVSHESSAAVMADVTARLTGVPGVCHATLGPGATNISTGTGGAFLDRSPMIVLTSETSVSMLGRTTQMNIDQQKLFAPVTKATFRLSASDTGEIIERALKISAEEMPGPVHIGLPEGLAGEEATPASVKSILSTDIPGNNVTEEINELLKKSKRPLVAVGLTAARLGLKKEVRSFLDKSGIPAVVTPMAKGMIREDHPCFAGVLFHALNDYLDELTSNADLIIGIGYDPVEYNYESWVPDVPLIHFGTTVTDFPDRDSIYCFTGMPEEWFSILDKVNAESYEDRKKNVADIRKEIKGVLDGFKSHFGPVAVLDILNNHLPEDSLITLDVGSHLHVAGQLWALMDRHEMIMTNGWSSMGFAIPAAIAGRFVKPSGVVAAITGDGGFVMNPGELITARRNNLNIIFIVLSDGELNLIKIKQGWKDISPYGTALYHGDLFGADTFLGIKVFKATCNKELEEALSNASDLHEPLIINCIIDPDDYRWLVTRK